MTLDFDPKAVVMAAIKSGLLKWGTHSVDAPMAPKQKLTKKVLKFRKHNRMTKFREARKAAGLNTATGKPLVRQKHPEIPKGNRRIYMRLYERKLRAKTRSERQSTKQ